MWKPWRWTEIISEYQKNAKFNGNGKRQADRQNSLEIKKILCYTKTSIRKERRGIYLCELVR